LTGVPIVIAALPLGEHNPQTRWISNLFGGPAPREAGENGLKIVVYQPVKKSYRRRERPQDGGMPEKPQSDDARELSPATRRPVRRVRNTRMSLSRELS
jgi:hypothetical protein